MSPWVFRAGQLGEPTFICWHCSRICLLSEVIITSGLGCHFVFFIDFLTSSSWTVAALKETCKRTVWKCATVRIISAGDCNVTNVKKLNTVGCCQRAARVYNTATIFGLERHLVTSTRNRCRAMSPWFFFEPGSLENLFLDNGTATAHVHLFVNIVKFYLQSDLKFLQNKAEKLHEKMSICLKDIKISLGGHRRPSFEWESSQNALVWRRLSPSNYSSNNWKTLVAYIFEMTLPMYVESLTLYLAM